MWWQQRVSDSECGGGLRMLFFATEKGVFISTFHALITRAVEIAIRVHHKWIVLTNNNEQLELIFFDKYEKYLHDGWDDELDSYILNEGLVCDELEDVMEIRGNIEDYHGCDFLPSNGLITW
ncbi:unnamed protein product [Vicia faba]|uniref:Uncharacterized protein n=1 Tax=Vicia faba TaxID=3906 RepID=A0AAV1A880_VICFA|nr:unnamed protein product [Vicia faba]